MPEMLIKTPSADCWSIVVSGLMGLAPPGLPGALAAGLGGADIVVLWDVDIFGAKKTEINST
jgi:hypothetical protein